MQLTTWSLFYLSYLGPSQHTTIMQDSFGGGGAQMSIGARLYSKQQGGLCVQASNWKAAVPLNMIGWCWESYHKLLLSSALVVIRQG